MHRYYRLQEEFKKKIHHLLPDSSQAEDDEFSVRKYVLKDEKDFESSFSFEFEKKSSFLLDSRQFSYALYAMMPSLRPPTAHRIYEQKKDKNGMIDKDAFGQTRVLCHALRRIHLDLLQESMKIRVLKVGNKQEFIGNNNAD